MPTWPRSWGARWALAVEDDRDGTGERGSPARRTLVAAVWLYQGTLSSVLGPGCRFYPSCSRYAVTAITRHGPLRGCWLAVVRVLRCHPWNPGGVDLVPDSGASMTAPRWRRRGAP